MDLARSTEGQIRKMFGMGSRSLTSKEKRLILSWTEKMGFDIEMIRLAYEITIEAVKEPSVSYANAILEKWYANKIDTPEKVDEERQKRAASKAAEPSKSYDVEDFFDAALRRTFSDTN
jgi:DnaD/phage-associated family protein